MVLYLLARETYVQCIRAMEAARIWIVTGRTNAIHMKKVFSGWNGMLTRICSVSNVDVKTVLKAQ